MSDDIRMQIEEDYAVRMGVEPGMHVSIDRTINRIEKTATSGLVDTYTIYYTDGTTDTYEVTNGAPGEQGPAGKDGADGVSPEISVYEITGGHRITIVDAGGTHTVDVMDGVDGKDGKDGKDGEDGQPGPAGRRGDIYLTISTNPQAYTTPVGGITPAYRIAKATVISESGVSEIYIGDVLERAYYLYPIAYMDDDYVYSTGRGNIRGATGADGQDGADGHTPVKGTDYWTAQDQADIVADVLAALPTWTGGSY